MPTPSQFQRELSDDDLITVREACIEIGGFQRPISAV